MTGEVEIRLIELLDREGDPIPTKFPQPLRDDVEEFVIFDGRLFRFLEMSALGEQEIATYEERSALLCGSTVIELDICGVDPIDIVDALRK